MRENAGVVRGGVIHAGVVQGGARDAVVVTGGARLDNKLKTIIGEKYVYPTNLLSPEAWKSHNSRQWDGNISPDSFHSYSRSGSE